MSLSNPCLITISFFLPLCKKWHISNYFQLSSTFVCMFETMVTTPSLDYERVFFSLVLPATGKFSLCLGLIISVKKTKQKKTQWIKTYFCSFSRWPFSIQAALLVLTFEPSKGGRGGSGSSGGFAASAFVFLCDFGRSVKWLQCWSAGIRTRTLNNGAWTAGKEQNFKKNKWIIPPCCLLVAGGRKNELQLWIWSQVFVFFILVMKRSCTVIFLPVDLTVNSSVSVSQFICFSSSSVYCMYVLYVILSKIYILFVYSSLLCAMGMFCVAPSGTGVQSKHSYYQDEGKVNIALLPIFFISLFSFFMRRLGGVEGHW